MSTSKNKDATCKSCGDLLTSPPGFRGPISQGSFGEDGPRCETPHKHTPTSTPKAKKARP